MQKKHISVNTTDYRCLLGYLEYKTEHIDIDILQYNDNTLILSGSLVIRSNKKTVLLAHHKKIDAFGKIPFINKAMLNNFVAMNDKSSLIICSNSTIINSKAVVYLTLFYCYLFFLLYYSRYYTV